MRFDGHLHGAVHLRPTGARIEHTPRPGRDLRTPWLEVAGGLLSATRPRQWVKNLLVFAAPAAGGSLVHATAISSGLLALVAFVVASAGTYLLNDVVDRRRDLRHPVKRHRPVASGLVSVPVAVTCGVGLGVGAMAIPAVAGEFALVGVIALYLGVNAAYNLGLKQVALAELVAVASGFVLRAVAGAVTTGIVISNWFLIVASFGALYVVVNKRWAELRSRGGRAEHSRATLGLYSRDLLREIRVTSAAVTIAAYVLWAFEAGRLAGQGLALQLSIIPFVLAMYRYAMVVDAGDGEAPEEIFTRDRPIQAYTGIWLALFAVAIYVG